MRDRKYDTVHNSPYHSLVYRLIVEAFLLYHAVKWEQARDQTPVRINEVQSEDGVGEQVPWVLQFGVHEVFASDYRIYMVEVSF